MIHFAHKMWIIVFTKKDEKDGIGSKVEYDKEVGLQVRGYQGGD